MKKTGIVIHVAFFALLALALSFFITSFTKPYSGLYLIYDNPEWLVESVDPNGTAFEIGFQPGDRVLNVNGQPAAAYLEKYEEQGFLLGALISSIEAVDDTGAKRVFDIDTSIISTRSTLELLVWLLVAGGFWAVGFMVYHKRPEATASLLLMLFSLAFGLALGANMAGERNLTFAIHVAVIAATVSPWLLLHFFLVLPEERRELKGNKLVWLIYLPATITLVLYPFIGFVDGQPLQDFRLVRLVGYGIGLAAVAVVVVLNYTRAVTLKTRQQMKIIMVGGLGAVFPFILLSVLPAALNAGNIMPASFSMLFVTLIPLSMGYAVLTRRFMDIDLRIRQGVIYTLVTLSITIVLVIAIYVMFNYRQPFGIYEIILVSLLIGALATALFGPVKNWADRTIDRLFYKHRYDYRGIVQELYQSLGRLNHTETAGELLTDRLVATLGVAGASLFIESKEGKYELLTGKGSHLNTGVIQALVVRVNEQAINGEDFPIIMQGVGGGTGLMVPMVAGGKTIGFLLIDRKSGDHEFTADDLYFVESVAALAALNLRSMMINAEAVEARRRYDEALRNAAEEWRITFDSIADMIAIIGPDHKILKVNHAFASAFGGQPHEFIGRTCHEVVHDLPELQTECPLNQVVATRQTTSHEIFEPKLGRYLECVISPLLDDLGNMKGVVHIFKDITARKAMETEQAELRNRAEISSRLATVGEMAAGIAHEINNPLTGVIGFAHLLLQEELPENIREEVQFIARDSDRIKNIVSRMLSIARQTKPAKTLVDIHEILDMTLELRRYTHESAGLKVVTGYDRSLPWIYGDPGQLQQVFINLIVNAEQAIKSGHNSGILTVTTTRDGDSIMVVIADNGPGLSAEVKNKLFNPFFTTKNPGEGTGLGLSISRQIIIDHGGTIEAESVPGEGAAFIIRLPAGYNPDEQPTGAS